MPVSPPAATPARVPRPVAAVRVAVRAPQPAVAAVREQESELQPARAEVTSA
jgi:hypothetical protein